MKTLRENLLEVNGVIAASNSKNEAIAKLKELGYEVDEQILEDYIKRDVKKVVLNDEQLESVTGGTEWNNLRYWGSKEAVTFLYNVNDRVEVASGFGFGTTVRCKITDRGYGYFDLANGGHAYFDIYYCVNEEYTWYFYDGWKSRDNIEKK